MSENVYDNPIFPDLAMEVRHACRGEMEEREERIVDIYVSADDPDTGSHAMQRNTAQEHHADSDETKKKHSRMAVLFLVLLCVLLFSLAVIIGVVIYFSELIKEKNNNLVKERDKIQSSFNELDSRLNNLTEEIEQSGFDLLTEEREDLKRFICELSGWETFGNGCYYVSTEKKNWRESRQYCEDRKSDLVIINSQEEQNFVVSLKRARVWLGLTDKEEEGTFRWVNGTPLNESQHPDPSNNNNGRRNCVVFFSQSRRWNVKSCNSNNWWICERVII